MVLVQAGDRSDRVGASGRSVTTGKLASAVEADDHVDAVAGLDERADAGDLVDLDRHGRAGRRRAVGRSVIPTPVTPNIERGDLGARRDVWPDDLADRPATAP